MTYKALADHIRQELGAAGSAVIEELEAHHPKSEWFTRLQAFATDMNITTNGSEPKTTAEAPQPRTRVQRPDGVFWVPDALFDLPLQIGPQATLIFACLTRHADSEGWSWPGSRRLIRECRLHSRNIKSGVAELVASNMIEAPPAGEKRRRGYRVLPPGKWKTVATVASDADGHCSQSVANL